MTGLEPLVTEFAIAVTNVEVWLSIALALVLGLICLGLGAFVTRIVGLLPADAPAGEILGVGLGSGLMVFAAGWAAIWSVGRSSFTPVAIGFAIAIGLAVIGKVRRGTSDAASPTVRRSPSSRGTRSLLLTLLGATAFVIATALLYGSTLAPSERDGVQPVEFTDEAFYSILGRDLATTGTETNYLPSGFTDLPDVPAQTWYHWAEIWLQAAVITIFGTAPLAARHFVVLPLVLLAAAALTGTLVRRMSRTESRRAYLFGFAACVFLAPAQLVSIPAFSASNVGLVFGVTTYGLAAVAVLLALYCLAVLDERKPAMTLAVFVGATGAFILPAHVAIALLGLAGVASVIALRTAEALLHSRRLPLVARVWRRPAVATAILLFATLVWGQVTGHSLGSGGETIAPPFNPAWREVVLVTILGGGVLFAIVAGWYLIRKEPDVRRDVFIGTIALVCAGALVWGARAGDFTMFHMFFGAIAVFVVPVAAIAIYLVWDRLRVKRHQRLAVLLVAVCVVQFEFAIALAIMRMQVFGPNQYEPIPTAMLAAISQLPPDSKLAYACGPGEEIGFATPRLLSIDAHTGRRVVPICFAAETLSSMIGAPELPDVLSLYFQQAPQRALYPDRSASPSAAEIAAFLKAHGVDYLYVDSRHPALLVDDAVLVAKDGDTEVFEISGAAMSVRTDQSN